MPITGPYHHVHLISPDPRAAAEWYVRLLGGEIVRDEELRGARNVRVMLGEAMLNVRGVRPTDDIVEAPEGKTYGIDHFCCAVSGIEAMLRHVEEGGGTISEPLFTLPSGNRAAYVRGPDGVEVELIEPRRD